MTRSFHSSSLSFLRHLLTDFHSSYTNLYFSMPNRVPFPHILVSIWALYSGLLWHLSFSWLPSHLQSWEQKVQSGRKQGMFLLHSQPTQLSLNTWFLIGCVKLKPFLSLALWLVSRTLVGDTSRNCPVNVPLVRILIFIETLLASRCMQNWWLLIFISTFWFQANQPLLHKQG